MSIPRSSICDLMKQVLVIHEPFFVKDLAAAVLLNRQSLDLWVKALEEEGLLEAVDKSDPFGNGYLYKRAGAFRGK